MKRTIFFDLDGTLIDTSDRHYKVYKDILKSCGISNTLSKQEYWNHKREGRKTVELLPENCSEDITRTFIDEWLERIEDKSYLKYDTLLQETLSVLSTLKGKAVLMLVTLRNNSENLLWELNNFGLTNYFKEILVSSPLEVKSKTPLIRGYLEKCSKADDFIIVGDSEMDISVGKEFGMLTIAVTYGIRSKVFLSKYKPDYHLDNLSETVKVLEETDNR